MIKAVALKKFKMGFSLVGLIIVANTHCMYRHIVLLVYLSQDVCDLYIIVGRNHSNLFDLFNLLNFDGHSFKFFDNQTNCIPNPTPKLTDITLGSSNQVLLAFR